MKFRFCGELDCPDWVLAEIATLSKLTSIKMKMLCIQVVDSLLGSQTDFQKIRKLTADAKYEIGDVKASIAALTYIFVNAAKHNIEEESLANELQQLGLPKESASAICRVLSEKTSPLQAKLKNESLKLTHIENVAWRVDFVLASNYLHAVNDSFVILCFHLKSSYLAKPEIHNFSMTSGKATMLLYELKQLHKKMEDILSS